MCAGEVTGMGIVLQEQRLEMGQVVIFSEQSPDAAAYLRPAIVPLVCLHVGKLVYQWLVYHEMLPSVRPWRLVFMRSDTFRKKTGHLKMRVPQQGGYSQA